MTRLVDENTSGLIAVPEFGFTLALVEGFTQCARLELEGLGVPGGGPDLVFDGNTLVVKLLTLQLELP